KEMPAGKTFHKDKTEMPNFSPDKNGEVLNNDFFGGDFKGIERKIPYLKSLGVTAIYLNPIFKAYSNHRYDTGDYMETDSLLGTKDDLKRLISSCKKSGIGLILDGVFNHTGSDSRYFNKNGTYDSAGAYNDENSPYRNWYKFFSYPDGYESWWGVKTLPATDKENGDYTSFIAGKGGVIDEYTSMGVKGWRLDVVDELPSGFVRKIRKAVKTADKDAVIIGEVWEDASDKISYGVRREYLCGKEIDGVMNYPLKNAIIDFSLGNDAEGLSYTVKSLVDHYPKISLDITMNILSTHDTPRILSVLSGRNVNGLNKSEMSKITLTADELELAVKRLKLASVLQFTFPGVPSVYYGDEAGMQGFFDPYNRAFFPWGKENAELKAHYEKLSEIRERYDVFRDGDFSEVFCGKKVYAFKRTKGESEVLVAVNAGETPCELSFVGTLYDAFTGESYLNGTELKPLSSNILINEVL
ncbi:MAG: glycoside hydrolase family 13 protein, partial [Clostridia bacterium]|nr:glycoside hydrolase family 13 protein [Clostridia bacterium]